MVLLDLLFIRSYRMVWTVNNMFWRPPRSSHRYWRIPSTSCPHMRLGRIQPGGKFIATLTHPRSQFHGGWVVESTLQNSLKTFRFQLLQSDLLIPQMEVTCHRVTPQKVICGSKRGHDLKNPVYELYSNLPRRQDPGSQRFTYRGWIWFGSHGPGKGGWFFRRFEQRSLSCHWRSRREVNMAIWWF